VNAPALRPNVMAPSANDSLPGELARLRGLLARQGERLRRAAADDPIILQRGLIVSDQVFARLLESADAPEPAPPPRHRWPPLTALAQRLGLDAFATDLILLLLAPEIEAEFAVLYAYAQDDAQRRWPTLALARSLFGGDHAAARVALLPASPLVRLRVVAVDEPGPLPLPLRALRLEEPVLAWLLGHCRADPLLAPALLPLPPPLLQPRDTLLADDLARRLAGARPVPRLRLTGPPRSGRRAVATAVGQRLGLTVVELDPAALQAIPGGEAPVLALLARDAALLDLAWLVDEAAIDRADRAAIAWHDQLRRGLEAFLVLLDLPGTPGPEGALEVEIPVPSPTDRLATWQAALPLRNLDPRVLRELVSEFDLGPREIAQAARAAGENASAADLRRAARARAAFAMGGLAERLVTGADWNSLVLPPATTAHLQEIAAAARGRALVMGEWGMAAGDRGRGLAVLFSGPSGTGKTTAAEVIARELDLDLWRVDLATTVSKWIGETEKNLKKIFDAAAAGGAILFFDEADALFGKRSEVKDARDRYANIEIDYLLQRMERHQGLAILATNRKGDLDPAFLRRLRHVVAFPFPDRDLRRAIWARAFPPSAPTDALDLDALSSLELAGGSIRNVALNAAFLAAAEGTPIGMAHLLRVARREYEKLERLPQGLLGLEPRP
jgi:hypothetical protein